MQGIVQHAFGCADTQCSDMQAALIQHLHRGLETNAFDAAYQLAGGHSRIFKDHVAGMGAFVAHLVVRLAQRHAGCAALNDKGADTGGAFDFRVGTGHHRVNARVWRVGDVTFGTVEDVAVSVTHSIGFQRARIGAGIWLGQAERAEQLAACQLRQVLVALLLCTVKQNAD
ncbi:hypothetical protein D3C76_1167960 [compost metagenome]